MEEEAGRGYANSVEWHFWSEMILKLRVPLHFPCVDVLVDDILGELKDEVRHPYC